MGYWVRPCSLPPSLLTHTHTHTHPTLHTHTHTHTHPARMHARTHTPPPTLHACMHARTRTHTHTHTHTPPCFQLLFALFKFSPALFIPPHPLRDPPCGPDHASPAPSFTNTPEDSQRLRLPIAPCSALPGKGPALRAVGGDRRGSVSLCCGLCDHGLSGYVCLCTELVSVSLCRVWVSVCISHKCNVGLCAVSRCLPPARPCSDSWVCSLLELELNLQPLMCQAQGFS